MSVLMFILGTFFHWAFGRFFDLAIAAWKKNRLLLSGG
jgi:hypothetical protein